MVILSYGFAICDNLTITRLVMPEVILSYLTTPGKNKDDSDPVQGTKIPAGTALFKMLEQVFERSESECRVPVRFVSESGTQSNQVRTEIMNTVNSKSVAAGMALGERLRDATTAKSGLGLLFVMVGSNLQGSPKAVLSRFPAEEGVLAETVPSGLRVEFVEKIFMKGSKTYKAATYSGNTQASGFWDGHGRRYPDQFDPWPSGTVLDHRFPPVRPQDDI